MKPTSIDKKIIWKYLKRMDSNRVAGAMLSSWLISLGQVVHFRPSIAFVGIP